MLQRKFSSCQAVLESNLLNIVKGRSPVHMPTESVGNYEMSRLPGFEICNGKHHYRRVCLSEYLMVLICTETGYQRKLPPRSLLKTIPSSRCRHLCLIMSFAVTFLKLQWIFHRAQYFDNI